MSIAKYIYEKLINRSIKNKLILYSITLLLLNLFIIGFISYRISNSTVIRIISETNMNILKQSIENVDFTLKGIEYDAINVFDKVNLNKYLEEGVKANINQKVENDKLIKSKIDKFISIRDEVELVHIIGENGTIFSNDANAKMEAIDKKHIKRILTGSEGRFVWTSIVKENYVLDRSNRIVMCRAIYDNNNCYNGFILIVLKESIFSDIGKNLARKNRQTFLVDENNFIISCPVKKNIGLILPESYYIADDKSYDIKKIENRKYLVSYIASDYTKWKLYIAEPYIDIIFGAKELRKWIVVVAASGILGLIMLTIIFSTMITVPIKKLLKSINNINNLGNSEELFNCIIHKNSRRRNDSFFSKLNFKRKLSIMLISVIMLPIIVLILVSYNITYGIVESKAIEINTLNTEQMKKRIEYYLKNFEKSVYYIYTDEELVENFREIMDTGSLKNDSIKDMNYEETIGNILEDVFGKLERQNRDISYLNFYDKYYRLCFSSKYKSIDISKNYFETLEQYSETKNIWFDTVKNLYNEYVITLGKKVKDKNDFYELGYLFITVREKDLENNYKNTINERDISFIINEESIVISHPNKSLLGTKLNSTYVNKMQADEGWLKHSSSNKDYIISYNTIDGSGWKIVNVSSMIEAKANMEKIIFYNFVVLLFSTLGIVGIVFFISNKISNPINYLTSKVSKFQNNDTDFDNDISTGDEIEQLSINFDKMMLRIKTLIEEVYEAKIKKHEAELSQKEAELATLQAQINPHFLYNTLEIIRWKAMFLTNGENEVTDIVTILSDFFRLSLNKGRKVIPLKDEIEHARNYISIINYRYNNKIIANWFVDTNIMNYIVPKIILQPIVENAVYHGIKPKKEQGIINVFGSVENEVIKLIIEDNGIGMDDEHVQKLNKIIEDNNTEEKTGYGLKNVNQRIKLYFGEKYGLTVDSRENQGTVVSIVIPAVWQKAKMDND